MREFKVFDTKATIYFECLLKHACAEHGLLSEHVTTIIAPQLATEEKNVDDLYQKLLHVSSEIQDVENLIDCLFNELLLQNVSLENRQPRLNKEDIHQFIWEYEHFILAEYHYQDHIKSDVAKLQKATTKEEKEVVQNRILTLTKLLHNTRLARQKYLDGFLDLNELQEKIEPTSSEAAQNETG
jgi:hypothetical protein